MKHDALSKELYDISMESQLTNLFIDIFVFKMTKVSAV